MTENNTDERVWVTRYNSKYHTNPDCMHLAKKDRDAKTIPKIAAERSRRELCKQCSGVEANRGGTGGKSKLELILERQDREVGAE